jgi:hypothetical protein
VANTPSSLLQDDLTAYYRSIAPELISSLPCGRKISSPLFLSVRREYETANRRLLIVGQETHSWYGLVDDLRSVSDPVGEMQTYYDKFELGRCCRKSFFCRVMHEIQRKLEPFVPPLGFMWSDLFSCDEKKTTPTNEIGDRLRSFRILPNEIVILRPEAIIFLSGPRYDYTIDALFPSCEFVQLDLAIPKRELARVKHTQLPSLTFRTYHPAGLSRQHKSHYLDLILTVIRKAWSSEA